MHNESHVNYGLINAILFSESEIIILKRISGTCFINAILFDEETR